MRFVTIAAAVALTAAYGPAQAALHKCKDSSGRTTYSDRACVSPQSGPRELPQATRRDPLNAPSPPQHYAEPKQATRAQPAPAAEAAAPAEPVLAESPATAVPAPRSAAGIPLLDGKVMLRMNSSFRFLDESRTKQVLTETWGNPPETAEGVLGMIMPIEYDPADENAWGVVITYSDDGYVSDEDASELDYQELLREMQAGEEEENEARAAAGYGSVKLVNWAEPPRYDAASHKIYWAKDLLFGDGPSHTLNYSIRVLGRQGVLELNAVADTAQLASIKRRMEDVAGFVEFTDGNRYADFNDATDRRAAYGIAALIAGGMAAKKVGLIALIAALAVKFWKLVAIAVVAVLGLLKAGGKKR